MDIFLIVVAGILVLVGFLGCILPVVPGVPLSYFGILLLHFTDRFHFSTQFLVVWAIIVVAIQVLDYYIPIWGTKRFGGSRWGMIGSAIGVVAGMFFGPLGILFGPFVGAITGELLSGRANREAIKAGFGSFVGFLAGTIIKLIASGFFIYYYVEALVA